MISQCNNSQQEALLNYIGEDYPKCLYLYLDVIKYGCLSDTTRTWIQTRDGVITSVVLSYHTALHVFSRISDFDVTEICELVKVVKPTMVNATAETIRKIEPELSKLGFRSEFGHIGEWMGSADRIEDDEVSIAKEKDIPEVARLLYEDENIGASYIFEDLLKQMQDRINEGYVRSYVLHKNNEVAAHVGTGAEIKNVCTIAYSITSPKYRGQGLAGRLYNYSCSQLKSEGKRIFSVYYPESARVFHHKVGFVDICKCGKLYLNI
jgi:N-acetylglutamate synthase-like GNAT family acetyltransferase